MATCDDCGRQKADDFDSQPDEGLCFSDEEHDHLCWKLTVQRLKKQVGEWIAVADVPPIDGTLAWLCTAGEVPQCPWVFSDGSWWLRGITPCGASSVTDYFPLLRPAPPKR
jgi:hypothetical protein